MFALGQYGLPGQKSRSGTPEAIKQEQSISQILFKASVCLLPKLVVHLLLSYCKESEMHLQIILFPSSPSVKGMFPVNFR